MATKKNKRVYSNLYQVTTSDNTSLAREQFFVVANTVAEASEKVEMSLAGGWAVTMVNFLGEADSKFMTFE